MLGEGQDWGREGERSKSGGGVASMREWMLSSGAGPASASWGLMSSMRSDSASSSGMGPVASSSVCNSAVCCSEPVMTLSFPYPGDEPVELDIVEVDVGQRARQEHRLRTSTRPNAGVERPRVGVPEG